MNVELPKDAEGREIQLDTKVLYDNEGKRRRVDWYTFYPDEDKWDVIFVDSCVRFSPHNFSLTKPDSWEKLFDDLDRCIEKDSLCSYYNPSGKCSTCILNSKGQCNCDSLALDDIKQRIRNLSGED